MYKAFRTNTDEISKLENSVKSTDIDKLKSLQIEFKQKIRPFILPKDGVIKGETLKDTYFLTSKDGKPYDILRHLTCMPYCQCLCWKLSTSLLTVYS